MRSFSTFVLTLGTFYLDTASAKGYNEGNNLGVDNYTPTSVQFFSANTGLQLDGIVFGTPPSQTFDNWGGNQACTVNGASFNGFYCIRTAIQEATWSASEGVRSKTTNNWYNVITLQGSNARDSAYSEFDGGQGSSCTRPTTFANQPTTCPAQQSTAGVPSSYYFGSRGIKVTCKAACGVSDIILQENWNSVTNQLAQYMRTYNFFAARFTVTRLANNQVLSRCRITSPNIGVFGIDLCPDRIPGSGPTVTAADSQPV